MKLYSIAPNKTLLRSVKLSYQADDKHDQSIISICPCNFEVKSSGSLVHEFCNEGSAVLMIKHSEKGQWQREPMMTVNSTLDYGVTNSLCDKLKVLNNKSHLQNFLTKL